MQRNKVTVSASVQSHGRKKGSNINSRKNDSVPKLDGRIIYGVSTTQRRQKMGFLSSTLTWLISSFASENVCILLHDYNLHDIAIRKNHPDKDVRLFAEEALAFSSGWISAHEEILESSKYSRIKRIKYSEISAGEYPPQGSDTNINQKEENKKYLTALINQVKSFYSANRKKYSSFQSDVNKSSEIYLKRYVANHTCSIILLDNFDPTNLSQYTISSPIFYAYEIKTGTLYCVNNKALKSATKEALNDNKKDLIEKFFRNHLQVNSFKILSKEELKELSSLININNLQGKLLGYDSHLAMMHSKNFVMEELAVIFYAMRLFLANYFGYPSPELPGFSQCMEWLAELHPSDTNIKLNWLELDYPSSANAINLLENGSGSESEIESDYNSSRRSSLDERSNSSHSVSPDYHRTPQASPSSSKIFFPSSSKEGPSTSSHAKLLSSLLEESNKHYFSLMEELNKHHALLKEVHQQVSPWTSQHSSSFTSPSVSPSHSSETSPPPRQTSSEASLVISASSPYVPELPTAQLLTRTKRSSLPNSLLFHSPLSQSSAMPPNPAQLLQKP